MFKRGDKVKFRIEQDDKDGSPVVWTEVVTFDHMREGQAFCFDDYGTPLLVDLCILTLVEPLDE